MTFKNDFRKEIVISVILRYYILADATFNIVILRDVSAFLQRN